MVPQSVSVKSFDKDTKKSSNSSFSFVESRVFKTDLEREVMRFSNKISSGAHKEHLQTLLSVQWWSQTYGLHVHLWQWR